jgi:uncharacterized protein YqfA (UPF0365 family)
LKDGEKVVLAEAEVPMAISQAFREGRFVVMDDYGLRHPQADTQTGNTLVGSGGGDQEGHNRN